MVLRYSLHFVFWLLICQTSGYAQQETMDMEELLMEQLPDDIAEDTDLSEIIDKLLDYQKNPLNLNTADERQLADLFFLSAQQIQSILTHRDQAGQFLSILELQSIRDIDFQTLRFLSLFVEVRPPSGLKDVQIGNALKESDQMAIIRYGRMIETQRGYEITDTNRSRYLGDANRYALRYRLNYENRIRLSLNMEKDAGEPFFREKQRFGFDFYSGHIAFNHLSRSVKQVVLGDYALQFGQGLVLWNGLSFGKGAWISSAARQGRGLVPYSSMNENNFHRGGAAKLAFGRFEFTPFVSYNRLSGRIEANEDSIEVIRTINYSGLHRTPTEQSYRRAIGQFNYGGNVVYGYKRLKLGVTYLSTSFAHPVVQGTSRYQELDFAGRSLQQLGAHYNFTYRNIYLFGEGATSLDGGFALNHGILASIRPELSVVAHYRNYKRNYHQYFAQSMGEGSKVANEEGAYAGLSYHPNRKIEWSTYVDFFRFPWLRYRVDEPSQGMDLLTQFSYTFYKKGVIKVRYRHRLKQENPPAEIKEDNGLSDVVRDQARAGFEYKLSDRWSIRNRAEWTRYEKDLDGLYTGWMVYQDIFWKGLGNRLQANIRVAYFDTEGYDARIYAYENDVLYASGFPVYYDQGIRSYLNIRWRVSRKVDVWGRYAVTKYLDKEEISSGLDLIEGDKRSDIKVQLRWQW